MRDEEIIPPAPPHPEKPSKGRRSLAGHLGFGFAWLCVGLGLLLVLVIGGLAWYTSTKDFERRVSSALVSVLSDATGGRVELRTLSFDLWHLAVEVDGLVIHGLEGPGEAPYLAADKVELRLKLANAAELWSGSGLASRIGLDLLRVEHPQFHLIIDKNGKTNQPVPKHPQASKEPLQDTLLDLKANELAVDNGVALLNDKAIPFNVAARNLSAQIHYLPTTDRYGIAIGLNDLRTQIAKQTEAQSQLKLAAELGRDTVVLKSLEFDSGLPGASETSVLHATATVIHLEKPQWQVSLNGALQLKQVSVLADVEGLTAGKMDLDLHGHSCDSAPPKAPTRPRFWQRNAPAGQSTVAAKPASSDGSCVGAFLVEGNAMLHGAGYVNDAVHLHDIDGGGAFHITPTVMLFPSLTGYLPGGGSATGELRFENWLRTDRKGPLNHAFVVATVSKMPLRTIMLATEPKGYGDLGFDTAVSGPVNVDWDNLPSTDNTVVVDAKLHFAPTGLVRHGALNNIPITGEAAARYDGRRDVIEIDHAILQTPQSTTDANGIVGLNESDALTNLKADLTVRDLGEFDQLFTTLGLEANGKKGTAAIPVVLHGAALFHGTVTGRAADLDWKGHLEGTNLEVKLGTALDTLVDSLVSDLEYSPEGGVAVASSTIKRNTAVLNLTGEFKPREASRLHGGPTYEWDGGTSLDTNLRLTNADLSDVLQIAGQQQKIPVTGKIEANAQVTGTFANLNGQGQLSLANGVAYGETFDSLVANTTFQGQSIDATGVTLRLGGMQITGNGGYDLHTQRFRGHVEGNNLLLAKFKTIAKANPDVAGSLNLTADADGTIDAPGLKAKAVLANLSVSGKVLGDIAADLHSDANVLAYTVQSTLLGAKLNATGKTDLTGNFDTQAKLSITAFDVATAIALYSPGSVKAQSSIGGVVMLNGPLKTPAGLNGSAQFDAFDLKLEGVELKQALPMRLGLKNGLVTLDQFHITGQDTDLTATGSVQLFGGSGTNSGKLNVQANGSVSVAIAHTFDPDILSSGKVEFSIAAGGQVSKPSLTGRVKFDNVNAAIEGIPNGLSALNGTLVFNQDRLQVESLVATTGGGQLKIGGFLTYQKGVYADLTATGDTVRVRLYGLSATANTSLKLQGSPQSAMLSGTILMTRFGVGADVDLAAFATTGGVNSAPDPQAASNKIRLDVHVTSSPQLDFQNSYAKLAGTVDLTLRGTVAEPTVLGRIQVTDGSATFAGTKYQLQRGDIFFSNPVQINPTVDVDATARVETYDVTVGLHGTASNPKFTYRSEPPLSEADIFALLALGRTQEESQIYQEREVQNGADPTTNALLGGALNATVSNRVGKLFGGGSVKIDPAFVGTLGNSAARITVQQQISRELSVTYATNVNSTAQQLLQGQYDLTPNVAVVVTRDESGVFSVVFKLRKRYR
jgi:translocation and assembly module TamB